MFKIWLCEAQSAGPAEEVVATELQHEITGQRKCEKRQNMWMHRAMSSQVREQRNQLTLKIKKKKKKKR